MVKTKMSFKKIMADPKYGSIIQLTNIYQDKAEGMQQMHYRYALQKNANIKEHYKEKMKEFFTDKTLPSLEVLYDAEFIYRDCIKSQTLLSNILKKLVKDYELLIRKRDRYGKYKYFVSLKALLMIEHIKLENIMNEIVKKASSLLLHKKLSNKHILELRTISNMIQKKFMGKTK